MNTFIIKECYFEIFFHLEILIGNQNIVKSCRRLLFCVTIATSGKLRENLVLIWDGNKKYISYPFLQCVIEPEQDLPNNNYF